MKRKGRTIRRSGGDARRAQLLAAMNAAAVAFISHSEENFDDVMTNALRPVTDAAALDRVCVFQNVRRGEGLHMAEVFRWDKIEGGGTVGTFPELLDLPYAGTFARWEEILSRGESIHGSVRDLPPAEAEFLSRYNVYALLVVPMSVDNVFWGFTLLLDMTRERTFDAEDIPVLRSIAFLCANTIIRNDAQRYTHDILRSLKRRDELMDTLNEVAVIFAAQTEDTFENIMANGLRRIADVANLDRIAMYRCMPTEGHAGQIYRWDRASGGTSDTPEAMLDFDYQALAPAWWELMCAGGCVNTAISDLEGKERAFLAAYGVKSIVVAPILLHGVFWGFVSFQDHQTERLFDNESVEVLCSAAFLCASTRQNVEMVSEIKDTSATLARHDALMGLLNRAAVTFVSQNEDTFEETLTNGLKAIAEMTKLGRVSIFRNFMLGSALHCRQIFRWETAVGRPVPIPRSLTRIAYADTPRMDGLLRAGVPTNSTVADLPPAEQRLFEAYGVKAFIAVPIFQYDEFWGFTLMENLEEAAPFDEAHVEVLQSAAFLCANTFIRHELERANAEQELALSSQLERQTLISEIARGFVAAGDVGALVGEALGKLGRYIGASRVVIVEIDRARNENHVRYLWNAEGAPPLGKAAFNLGELAEGCFPTELPEGVEGSTVACNDVANGPDERFRCLADLGISAFIWTAIYVEGRFWGLLSLEQCGMARVWSEGRTRLVGTVASSVVGVLVRDLYDKERAAALANAVAARQETAAAELRTRAILDNAPIGCLLVDENADAIDCNEEFMRILGTTDKQRVVDRYVTDFAPEYQLNGIETRTLMQLIVRRALAGETVVTEWLSRSASGEIVPTEVTVARVQYGDRTIAIGYSYDLRGIKKMQKALADAEERSRAILSGSPVGCVIVDENLNVLDCNEGLVRLFGAPSKQYLIDNYITFEPAIQPDGVSTGARNREVVSRAMGGERMVYEWMYLSYTGEEIPCEGTITRVDYGGVPVCIGYIYDLRSIKRMEREVAEAEERSRAILSSAPVGCIIVDADSGILHCNEEFLRLLGADSTEDFIERLELFTPPFQPDGADTHLKTRRVVEIAMAGERRAYEWLYRHANGEEIPCEITVMRLEYGGGPVCIAYVYDLRSIRRLAQEVADAEERVRVMMNAAPLGCSMFDADLNLMDCNEALMRTYDVTEKAYFLKHFYDYSPEVQPDGVPSIQKSNAMLTRALAGELLKFEWMHQKLDGEPVEAEITLQRVQYHGAYAVLGYQYDLRDLKRMQRRILERDAQLQARLNQQSLVSGISQAFLSGAKLAALMEEALAQVGRFMQVSRASVSMLNLTNAEALIPYLWIEDAAHNLPRRMEGAHTALDVFPADLPENSAIPSLSCDDVLAPGNERYAPIADINMRAFIWRPLYVNGRLWGIFAIEQDAPRGWAPDETQLVGVLGDIFAGVIMRDIQSKERDAALDQAVVANQAKSAFLSNMSHEMRTPMNAILGMTMIGKNAAAPERKDYALDQIEESSTQLLSLINDVLDMSKIEAGKLEIYPVDFLFEKMLRRVVTAAAARADEKGLGFRFHIDPAIPHALFGDERRLAQVMTNLLSNAVKFTPEGGEVRLNAALTGEAADGMCELRVEVADTGIGIPLEQQAGLFQAFQQVESASSRRFGGTGLGLAISKRLVELMGGRIWVESEAGKGSTFIFTALFTRGDTPKPLLDPSVNRGNLRVLAVDDASVTRAYFTGLFGRIGLPCDVAENGEDALSLIEKQNGYDIYFLDWHMPGIDGIELARRIRQTGRRGVVVMMSASDWSALENDARAAGVTRYLPKPLFESAVLDCLNDCLGAPAPDEADANLSGCHILLAEDAAINREIARALFEDTGLAIDTALNGGEAVRRFQAAPEKYDLILMNDAMPEMDGCEAARRIRRLDTPRAADIPIVAMLVGLLPADVARCLAAGMNDAVGKPLDVNEVTAAIRKYRRPQA